MFLQHQMHQILSKSGNERSWSEIAENTIYKSVKWLNFCAFDGPNSVDITQDSVLSAEAQGTSLPKVIFIDRN